MTTLNAANGGIEVRDGALEVAKFVRKYVNENDRGCPKGALQFIGKFTAKDIKRATDNGLIQSGRGSEGGFYPFGEKPEVAAHEAITLKSRMVEVLRAAANGDKIDADFAGKLVKLYEAECAKRAAAQAKVVRKPRKS